MEDAENNFQPSKKRAAGVQLSRDNPGLDEYEGTCENEEGTFKRASDEVLASRRILKVRRHQTSSAPSVPDPTPSPAPNPFAAIRLVPPVSSTPPVEVVEHNTPSKETEAIVETDSNDANKSKEPKVESNLEAEKTDVTVADDTKQPEVVKSENSGDVAENGTHISENEIKKDAEDERNEEKKGNGEDTVEKKSEATSFNLFQKFSSGQNAFSGFTGTGFSSTTFSSGSTPKDDSPTGGLKNDHSSFGFGVYNNGSTSLFGTFGTNIVDKSESSKSSSMPEVPVETGEENEKTVFTAFSVLFEFVAGSWKERGKGELKLNEPTRGTGRSRLVMRAQGNYRLILNANLFPDLKLTNMDKKGITFACVNSAGEGKDGLSTIALKFKDASIVEDFRAAVTMHKDNTNVALKTPENSP